MNFKQAPQPTTEIGVQQAYRLKSEGTPVFDVRPATEMALGCIEDARQLDAEDPAGALRAAACPQQQPVLIYCATGRRSAGAVQALQAAGYSNAVSITGGFHAWREAGLPCRWPDGFDHDSVERYARHLALPEVGLAGQAALGRAGVLIIGAGGLGSPAALYLAAAGIGRLGIVDDDVVERSNLQRQILHVDAAAGSAKTDSAHARIQALNPTVEVVCHAKRLGADNVETLLRGWDLVLDGADNLATKNLLNRACVEAGLPLVYGAVMGFDGQVSLFDPGSAPGRQPCYECLFPAAADGDEPPDCNTAGVLGVVPGLIGVMQAAEAIKWLLGIGETLAGRLLLIDTLRMQWRTVRARPDPACPVCSKLNRD